MHKTGATNHDEHQITKESYDKSVTLSNALVLIVFMTFFTLLVSGVLLIAFVPEQLAALVRTVSVLALLGLMFLLWIEPILHYYWQEIAKLSRAIEEADQTGAPSLPCRVRLYRALNRLYERCFIPAADVWTELAGVCGVISIAVCIILMLITTAQIEHNPQMIFWTKFSWLALVISFLAQSAVCMLMHTYVRDIERQAFEGLNSMNCKR